MNEVREILESMPELEQILPFVDGIIANMVQQQSGNLVITVFYYVFFFKDKKFKLTVV